MPPLAVMQLGNLVQKRGKKAGNHLEGGWDHPRTYKWLTRWWFQIFFIFTPTWGDDPI